MRKSALLLGLGAALLLAAAASSASANKLSLSERAVRITWSEYEVGLKSGTETMGASCPVTMEGTFSSASFNKIANATIGSITRTALNRAACTERSEDGGYLQFLVETLPWALRYRSFFGTLPNITEMRIDMVGMAVRIVRPGFFECLIASTNMVPADWHMRRERNGAISELTADEGTILPSPRGLCELLGTPYYQGVGRVTKAGTTEGITLSLM